MSPHQQTAGGWRAPPCGVRPSRTAGRPGSAEGVRGQVAPVPPRALDPDVAERGVDVPDAGVPGLVVRLQAGRAELHQVVVQGGLGDPGQPSAAAPADAPPCSARPSRCPSPAAPATWPPAPPATSSRTSRPLVPRRPRRRAGSTRSSRRSRRPPARCRCRRTAGPPPRRPGCDCGSTTRTVTSAGSRHGRPPAGQVELAGDRVLERHEVPSRPATGGPRRRPGRRRSPGSDRCRAGLSRAVPSKSAAPTPWRRAAAVTPTFSATVPSGSIGGRATFERPTTSTVDDRHQVDQRHLVDELERPRRRLPRTRGRSRPGAG